MHKFTVLLLLSLLVIIQYPQSVLAKDSSPQLEILLNDYLDDYPLSPDNLFKLAVYMEMRGEYSWQSKAFQISFGSLGSLSFFRNNCILKTGHNRVFHLSRDSRNQADLALMNEALEKVFGSITLLSNHGASADMVAFVDRCLARKNIEPFNKIFIRHILLKHGKFDASQQRVEFHTSWLPSRTYSIKKDDEDLVKKYITPLKIRLDDQYLRGYYIQAGGTVYVENVDRDVRFATGEEYHPNVSAFKLFIQKLFIQSVQFVVKSESDRLETSGKAEGIVPDVSNPAGAYSTVAFFPEPQKQGATKTSRRPSKGKIKPLYDRYAWIGMMLGILRNNNIAPGDPEVLQYYINQPYYERIYAQMTEEEKSLADQNSRLFQSK